MLRPSYRLAALAFIVSVVYWPTIFSAPFMPRWWVIAIGLPLLCDLVPKRIDRTLGGLFLLGLSWAGLQFMFIEDPFSAILPLYFMILLGLAFVAASNIDDVAPVLTGASCGIAVSSVICILQVSDISPVAMIANAPAGLFLNTEVLAEIAAPLLIWAVVARRWPLAAFLLIPIVLCNSRIALLGVALGLLYAYGPKRFYAKALVAILALAAIFLGLTILRGHIDSASQRLTLWGAALYSITPLGQGLGWWENAHPFTFEEFVHSDLLQFLVELGIGGLFFIAIPVLIFWRGIENKALGACFAVLCLEATVSFPLHVPATALLFAIVSGFLARDRANIRIAECESRINRRPYLRWPSAYSPGMAHRRHWDGSGIWD